MDDRFGARAVIIFLPDRPDDLRPRPDLGRQHHRVFFFIRTEAAPEGAFFASLPEQVFIGLGGLIGAVSGPLQASCRSLLIRLAPPDRMTQYFGLMALSGKLTSFLAPLAVSVVTSLTSSQPAGMSVILVFFCARPRPSHDGYGKAGRASGLNPFHSVNKKTRRL
ncbi:MFS transporter [Roseibium salinum]|nr:MFS transporter [Roseibium salinum]